MIVFSIISVLVICAVKISSQMSRIEEKYHNQASINELIDNSQEIIK